ncbi:MAG: hypothetical protein FWG22_01990 [Prolixibacteraceae bacterium]|nr:hypothetical protein [Prolixibacteraceae bacterium]
MKNYLPYILFLLSVAIVSCDTETETSKGNIHNFDALSSQFAAPSREFGTAPLYVWNTTVTKELLDATMRDLKDKGFGGVFVHPRPGLITEYISDEWFELFRFALDKGKELDMNVWIYDENSYPSGFAGGHVPAQMPESFNQGQGLRLQRFDVLPDDVSRFFLIMKEEDGKLVDVADVDAEKGKTGKYCLFAKTYHGKSPWHGGFSYVDLLYQGVTEKFITTTMSGYEKVAGDEFGKFVPGWFTDEPHINPPGGIRWTPDLFDIFQEKWGYDLKSNLLSLFGEYGDWKKVRHNYTQTLLQLFIDRWAKPCFEYCEENGLKFTGHYWEHGWPDMSHGGDNMAMYAWHQTPAIDMLFNQFNDVAAQAQFGNVRSVKELSSVANQMGYTRTLSETYGGGGWEETFRDFKRLGDWEFVLGVNFMNQHLTHLSLAGARKYDYPPSFSEHSPWWGNYKPLNMHYARLSMALSAGAQQNDILILEPNTTIWQYYAYSFGSNYVWDIANAFQSMVTALEKVQVEYDLGSENIIKDQGKISGKKFFVAKRGYSKVVIPPLTENVDASTFKLLKEFATKGGTILTFARPEYMDGSLNDEVKAFFVSDKVVFINELTPDVIKENFAPKGLQFSTNSGGYLLHHRRMMDDGQVVFLTNSSLEEYARGSLLVDGKDAVELNTFTGEIYDYPEMRQGAQINISYELPPAGSLLLYVFNRRQSGFTLPEVAGSYVPMVADGGISAAPVAENVMAIDYCDLQLGKETFKNIYTFDAADKLFKYHGFVNGNPWNTSVQYKDNIVSRDTFTTGGCTVTYKFTVDGDFELQGMKAVIERAQLYEVSLNGKTITSQPGKWWLDRSMAVFAIGNEVRKGENLLTLKLLPMKIHAEIEPVYILGSFTLAPASAGWTVKAPGDFSTGSWKAQGWPFYPGTVAYVKNYNVADVSEFYRIKLNEWQGTVAEVLVNGNPAGIIFAEPYTLDVSKWIKQGANKVELKIVGSNKNLLGPLHSNYAPGLVGPWLFRGPAVCPPGNEYRQLDYGLMGDFLLEKGN